MTQQIAESGTDADVAAALGVGSPAEGEDEGQEGAEHEAQVAEDVPLEELPTKWQEEVRRLRREAAQNRVARREATRATNGQQQGDGDGTPSAQALRAAEERGRTAARMEHGIELAGAEVRAALAANLTEEQIEDLVEDLNLTRFVTDDGGVDREAIKHFRDKTTSILGRKTTPRPGHGQRQGTPAAKSNADLFGDWLQGG